MPIKLSVHAFHINLYLYQYIEPILFFFTVLVYRLYNDIYKLFFIGHMHKGIELTAV